MRPAPLERKHSKVGTPRPSKHAPVVNQPSEAGSFRSRSYGEYQQKRHPDGHTGILETSGAGTGFIPAWILRPRLRSEEHTSELRHLVISYAVFCLKKKTHNSM